jgi:hypothetical protein
MQHTRLCFGLEKEFFVMPNGTTNSPILVPSNIPKDECGYLAEARGLPSPSIEQAVYSVKAECYRIETLLETQNLIADDTPILKISKELLIAAQRQNVKGLIQYNNLYGHQCHKNKANEVTASVHISFTKPETSIRNDTAFTYNAMFDYVDIFKKLDAAFAEEIKAAKRNPGFYEIKQDGRIEYRSLPSDVNLHKVIDVINKIIHG